MPLPNKAGEPEFKLKLEPSDKVNLKFKTGEETTVDLKITNPLKDRQSFKVKCTDNEIFRVRPPLGFVKPNESTTVKITLKAKSLPDPQRHFFAIYHVACNDLKATARAVWTSETKPEGVIRLQAAIEESEKKEDGEKKEEKKEDEKKEDEKKEEKKDEKKEEEKKEDEKK